MLTVISVSISKTTFSFSKNIMHLMSLVNAHSHWHPPLRWCPCTSPVTSRNFPFSVFTTFLHFSFLFRALGQKMVLLITGLDKHRQVIKTTKLAFFLCMLFLFVSDTFLAWENLALMPRLCIAAFSAVLQVSFAFWRLRPWNFGRSCHVPWSHIREFWHITKIASLWQNSQASKKMQKKICLHLVSSLKIESVHRSC